MRNFDHFGRLVVAFVVLVVVVVFHALQQSYPVHPVWIMHRQVMLNNDSITHLPM